MDQAVERLRWRLWNFLSGRPGICPAHAHSLIIWGERRSPRIDRMCRRDLGRNGSCWCGKLREADRG